MSATLATLLGSVLALVVVRLVPPSSITGLVTFLVGGTALARTSASTAMVLPIGTASARTATLVATVALLVEALPQALLTTAIALAFTVGMVGIIVVKAVLVARVMAMVARTSVGPLLLPLRTVVLPILRVTTVTEGFLRMARTVVGTRGTR
ncbi:hypothetical protein K501DRAFT_268054 [Backusella circina FSU 941]|nr:hypothetical protein K501DRAFT_268054 [Backusella circina FSU 941]